MGRGLSGAFAIELINVYAAPAQSLRNRVNDVAQLNAVHAPSFDEESI